MSRKRKGKRPDKERTNREGSDGSHRETDAEWVIRVLKNIQLTSTCRHGRPVLNRINLVNTLGRLFGGVKLPFTEASRLRMVPNIPMVDLMFCLQYGIIRVTEDDSLTPPGASPAREEARSRRHVWQCLADLDIRRPLVDGGRSIVPWPSQWAGHETGRVWQALRSTVKRAARIHVEEKGTETRILRRQPELNWTADRGHTACVEWEPIEVELVDVTYGQTETSGGVTVSTMRERR